MNEPRTFDDYAHAGAWLRAAFGQWADSLSEAEHDAILFYASPAYKGLNRALRAGLALSAVQQRQVDALDRALRAPLPEPVIAYRGIELLLPRRQGFLIVDAEPPSPERRHWQVELEAI